MNEPNVILINRALPYNCVGRLTGRSGVEYGQSVYEEAHGAHVCRISLGQWRACKEDVTYGMMRRWSQWEVDWEGPEIGDRSSEMGGGETENGKWKMENEGEIARGLESERGLGMGSGGEVQLDSGSGGGERLGVGSWEGGEEEREVFSEVELGRVVNYRKLVGMAKRVGVVDAERLDSTADLRVAILERQKMG